MNDEIKPPTVPQKSWGRTNKPWLVIVWFLVAFVPSIVAMPLLSQPSAKRGANLWLLIVLAAVCCVVSGIGVMRVVENRVLRIVLGLFLAVGFFALNALIVVFVGCVAGLGR
jgi:hypothetical protein